MNCFDDYRTSGAPPVRSNYIRKDEALDDLWENSVATGINFSKYEDIKVVVKGENIPKQIEKFTEAGFSPLLKSNIQRAKYSCPTPVQKYAIPIIQQHRDLMACAQTGELEPGQTCLHYSCSLF